MRSRVILLIFALLLLGLALKLGLGPRPVSPPLSADPGRPTAAPALLTDGHQPYSLSGPLAKRVELRTTWTNVGPKAIQDLRIYVAVPPSLPEQEIAQLTWSPEPSRYLRDRYGQEIADFEVDTLRPGGTVTIGFTVVGRFWRIKYDIAPDEVGSLDEIPEEIARLYLADGPYYRISDPLIAETARRVVGEERNPYLMALRIHDFVAKTLDYKLDGRWDDAPTVLRRGSGSCSEFTFLFIALARAVGLPARYAGGSVYIPSQAWGGRFVDRYNHRWAEVYLPGYGWVPFDPTWDHPRSGRPVGHEYAGSHGYALVFDRGDLDERYLGISYIDTANGGPAGLEEEREVVWSDP